MAERVREIFRLYLRLGALIPVLEELERREWRKKAWTTRDGLQRGGSRFSKTTLHALITNVAYVGRVQFEGKLFDGEQQRVVDDETFDEYWSAFTAMAAKASARSVTNMARFSRG